MNGNFEISLPSKYMLSYPAMDGTEQNPDYNLMLAKYSNNILLRGWKTEVIGGMGVSKIKELSVDEFLLIMSFGGGVKYFNPFIKVAEADIDNTVSDGLPNREFEICVSDCENDEPVMGTAIHSWRTWRDANHPLGEPVEGYYYFVSASFGAALKDTELLIISNEVELVDEI